MANDTYKRAPGKGKFALLGVDLVHPPDLMPQGRAPYLLNVIASRQQGALQARAGTTAVNSVALDQTNIHSLIRVNNAVPGASPTWARFVGAGTKLYSGQASFTSRGTGYSGNPLSLVADRPPMAPDPYLYAFDSSKQAKYTVGGTEYPIGVAPPPEPTITQTAPIVKDLGQYTATTGWSVANAANTLLVGQRVPTGTTVSALLYDTGTTGWVSIIPSNTAFATQATVRPSVSVNGWAANAHVGAYEMGVDQAHGWGLSSDTTDPYQNPGNVSDANNTTYASALKQHTHRYAGCIWAFSGATTTLGSTLNILSEVPENGVNGVIITQRSAGVWYSTDGGTTWTSVYDSGTRTKSWDSILLPSGIAYSQIQVMAFMDAHDDMAHNVFEINISSSPHNSAYSFGARLVIGSETVTAKELFASLPSTTVQAVAYDAAGVATVQPALAIKGVARNRLVTINGQNTRVLDVTEGPDGGYSFRVKLAGIVAAQSLVFPLSVRTYTANTHAAGEGIASGLITAQLAPADLETAVGVVSYALTADLTNAGGRPLQSEDYMHVSLRFSSPANVVECHVMVDVDSTTNDFTGNYYYYVIRQNDFQQVSGGVTSTQDSLIDAVTNQVALSYNQTEPGQLPLGDSQYLEATFRLNDLVRAGSDPTVNLSGVKAIGIRVIVNGATAIQFGSWWVGGTYGPDANWNNMGNQGTPIKYRYRYRSSINGAISNPGPATRAGELPARNGVLLGVTASTDTQVDLIDIERIGGTLDTWHECLTVANATATVTDDVTEEYASAMDGLELGQYQPWPITDKPRTATVNVVGTRVTATSGTPFNVLWVPGTEVIIGNKTYTLYTPPESNTVLTLAQNAGVLSSVTARIPEATIAAQPLPWVCLGPEGRKFATGDPYNPGLLYFTNPYSETASDQGYIEITNPSETLGPPRYLEGAIYVTSTENLYRVDSTPGAANPFGAYKLSGAPGNGSPWAISKDGSCYLGPDGIYEFNGSSALNMTDGDLLPLFPHEGKPGVSVPVAGLTIYPPDYGQPTKLRLSRTQDFLFFDYVDTQGTAWTLTFSKAAKGWVFYSYAVSATIHYEEEGLSNPSTLVGHSDGIVALITSALDDRGTAFTCRVKTPADDQGESRARKQYGDLLLDYGGITAGSSAAGTGGTGNNSPTGGSGGSVPTLADFVGVDIGPVNGGTPGSTTKTSTTLTLFTSSGSIDWNGQTSESAHFAYVQHTGPIQLTARLTAKSDFGTVGLMVRSALTATAPNFIVGPGTEGQGGWSIISEYARLYGQTGGNQNVTTIATPWAEIQLTPPTPLVWFRIRYEATGLCSAWYSTNGTSWTSVWTNGQVTAGATPIYIGFVGSTGWLSGFTSIWDNVTVSLT